MREMKELKKLTRFLYRAARKSNDIETLLSGDIKRIARRGKNKYVGKKFIRKVWKWPF